jgi:RNA polymerase sigma factor (sigma-70 family)
MVQDLAVVVLAHRAVPVEPQAFAAWCRSVARNIAAHRRRSQARRRVQRHDGGELEIDAASTPPRDDPERIAECKQLLASHVDGLDRGALALLFDRFVLEETSAEIGARLNVSAVSIRMRIARLVAALRDQKTTEGGDVDRYALSSSGNS